MPLPPPTPSASFWRATLTLLTGGALAQLLPLLLGPVLARLFTPQAFGLFTQFSTVAATLAVAASLRFEQALPLARRPQQARALLALCLRVLLAATALAALAAAGLAWAGGGWLAVGGPLPWPALLPLAVLAAGLLQVLMLWANRAGRFGALAASRVVQYGGAALLQLALGWALWRASGPAAGPGGAGVAWALALAPVAAALLAALPLCRPAPVGGWRGVCLPLAGRAARRLRLGMAAAARRYRDFALLNTPHAFLGTAQDALAVALLAAWAGDAAAGFWGLALRYLKAPATLVGSAVSQALYPRLAAAAPAEAQRMVRQVMALLGALALAGPWLFARVFGEPWREAGALARALAPYIGAHFVAAPLAVVTMAWQAQRWAFRLALAGQAVFLAALAAGLHWGGLQGGAWAVSAAMLPYFGWYFWRLAHWQRPPAPAAASAPTP